MQHITSRHIYNMGYIILADIQLDNVPPTLLVDDEAFERKAEFHITQICVKNIAAMITAERIDEVSKKIVAEFVAFNERTPLTTFTLTDQYYLMHEDAQKTVVVLCDMPALAQFFAHLEKLFGVELPLQPAHITLYTHQSQYGIGILSQQELHQKGTPIELPELASLHVV